MKVNVNDLFKFRVNYFSSCCLLFLIIDRHQKCTLIYHEVGRTLQRLRNRGVPKAPKSVDDIQKAFQKKDIYEFYCKTDHENSREVFFDYLYECDDFSYCIFSSKKIIQLIQSKTGINDRHYLIDATFKVVPYGPFTQLLIIHYAKFETIHPFVYILMSNKSQVAYTHVFKYIDKHIFSLRCASFTTDYETAMKNSLSTCFPNSKLVSCWFHYVQAIRRKVSKLQLLFKLIRTDSNVTKIYYMFQALALLEKNMIISAFESLKIEALKMNAQAFTPFIEYFERQWIKKVCIFTHPFLY